MKSQMCRILDNEFRALIQEVKQKSSQLEPQERKYILYRLSELESHHCNPQNANQQRNEKARELIQFIRTFKQKSFTDSKKLSKDHNILNTSLVLKQTQTSEFYDQKIQIKSQTEFSTIDETGIIRGTPNKQSLNEYSSLYGDRKQMLSSLKKPSPRQLQLNDMDIFIDSRYQFSNETAMSSNYEISQRGTVQNDNLFDSSKRTQTISNYVETSRKSIITPCEQSSRFRDISSNLKQSINSITLNQSSFNNFLNTTTPKKKKL